MIYIINILFSLLSGFFEALLDHINIKWDDRFRLDKHWIYIIVRLIFGVVVLVLAWGDWLLIAACLLQFPFVHDGTYYVSRNTLAKNRVYSGWFATGDKNWKGFSPIFRSVLFVMSLILINVS